MKRISFLLIMVVACLETFGQRNPVDGYIITNQNDTVRGTVDYRTAEENCISCHFKADGEEAVREYLPADIKGYRFLSDGVYYVSRPVEIDGASKQVFVEFIIQGGVSLMQYTSPERDDYFIFVGEDGNEVTVKDDNYWPLSDNAQYLLRQRLIQRRALFQVFGKSAETLDKLCQTPFKAERLAPLVRQYDEAFCSEVTDCVQFVYDQKKSRRLETRLIIEGGMMLGDYVEQRYFDHSVLGHRLCLGVNVHSSRKAPALYYNIMVGISYWEMSGWTKETIVSGSLSPHVSPSMYWSDKQWLPELTLGAEYHFLYKKKHTPFVAAGFYMPNFVPGGLYGGIGYEIKAGRHKLRVSATYSATVFKMSKQRYKQLNATLGFVL